MQTGVGRQEMERDYDRVLFLAPTRRLADKTQVFPMEVNDSVRTRLTHSHEVSNLARSIGTRLVYNHRHEVFGEEMQNAPLERLVPPMLAAVGLAHDLGNPPFGHQGEKAIRKWFKDHNHEKFEPHSDFLQFDGNGQTFRLLTKLQILRDEYGLNLTCGSLAALLKYPVFHNSEASPFKKWGVFESERNAADEVWDEVGLVEGQRHPLAYVMEACDDIAYSVIDAEDTVKKGYASFNDLIDFLLQDPDEAIGAVVTASQEQNEKFKQVSLSSAELNDLSMQMFRVKAIAVMVTDATEAFVQNIGSIMAGEDVGNLELIESSKSATLCKRLKAFDYRFGFRHPDVLKLELEGSNYIQQTMSLLWKGIHGEAAGDPFGQYAYGRISENYRRVYESTEKTQYDKCQLLCDSISGMTEKYLISLHDELAALEHGRNSSNPLHS